MSKKYSVSRFPTGPFQGGYASRKEAVAAGTGAFPEGDTLYTVELVPVTPTLREVSLGDEVLFRIPEMIEDAYEEVVVFYDELTGEQMEELDALLLNTVLGWLKSKGMKDAFCACRNARKHKEPKPKEATGNKPWPYS